MHRTKAIYDEIARCELELSSLRPTAKSSALGPMYELHESHFLGAGKPIEFENRNPDAFHVIHYTIKIKETPIDVKCDPKMFIAPSDLVHFEKMFAMKAFIDWCNNLDPKLMNGFKTIYIESYNMFGPNMGFLKFRTDMTDPETKSLRNTVTFMRGGCACVLPILISEESRKKYAVVTIQARVPVGKSALAEIPAGMMDDESNFKFVASKEMKEETDIEMKGEDLVDMIQKTGLKKPEYPGIYLSPGGTDEFMNFLLYVKHIPEAEIKEMQGKKTGNGNESENIKIKIVPLETLADECCADAKTMVALFLYSQLPEHIRSRTDSMRPLPGRDIRNPKINV